MKYVICIQTKEHNKFELKWLNSLHICIKMNRLLLIKNFVSSLDSQTQSFSKIIIERIEEVGTIWLNSPADKNTMNFEQASQLLPSLVNLDNDSSIKVIVLRSKVKNVFSYGGDIKQLASCINSSQTIVSHFEKIRFTIRGIRKPIISVVQGEAFGGGLQIALLSDIIICSKDAHFGLPEIKIGIIPGGGGTQTLPRHVKQKNAMRMILTGETINAQQAHRLNIALLISNNFQEKLQSLIYKIVNKPIDSLLLLKKAVKLSSQTATEEGLVHEADLYPSLMGKQGPMEGVTAFLQKRAPNFKGI